ncbi:MAG: hypothetical protein WCA35_20665 [Kovacikia sp.]
MPRFTLKPSNYFQSLIALVAMGLIGNLSLAQEVVPIKPGNPAMADSPVIMLGQPKETPFVVIIPTSDLELLEKVQQHAPLAFMTSSRLGPYIQAAAFADLPAAESLNDELRQQGLDSRVIYLHHR